MMADGGVVVPNMRGLTMGTNPGMEKFFRQTGGDISSYVGNIFSGIGGGAAAGAGEATRAGSFGESFGASLRMNAGPDEIARTALLVAGGRTAAIGAAGHAIAGPLTERIGVAPEASNLGVDITQTIMDPTNLGKQVFTRGKQLFDIGKSLFDYHQARGELDRSGGGGGGTTEGTITIEHQETGQAAARKTPLFRAPKIARQSQMEPAVHGPDNHWSNSAEVVH
jgi:hypothetical protein